MTLEELVNSISLRLKTGCQTSGIYVVGVTGFPCCGKSTIAKKLAEMVQNFRVLEAEYWIKDFDDRLRLDISGVSLEAYEAKIALNDINSFKQGAKLNVTEYSHVTKKRSGAHHIYCPEQGTGLILDGCIFADVMFQQVIDYNICIIPADIEEWFANCVSRDVDQRHFSKDFSGWHTIRKFVDMQKILQRGYLYLSELFECRGNLLSDEPIFSYERIPSKSNILSLLEEGRRLWPDILNWTNSKST